MADKPDYQNDRYATTLREQWQQVDSVLGGTYAMRKARDLFLPQFPAEADEVYNDRLNAATFDNDYVDTLDGIVGMVFRRPPQIGESVPSRIRTLLENVDLAGTHFNVFASRFVRKGIHLGAAYVVVDMQRRPAEMEGQQLDDAEARGLGLRPYWIAYGANEVQNAPRYVTIGGVKTLQQIVFRECATVPDGEFGEAEVVRFRVWRLPVELLSDGQYRRTGSVEWQIWGQREQLEQIDSGVVSGLSEIPVAAFIASPDPYSDHDVFAPTLLDLSFLCIKHWQQQSDHESNLHLCSSPIPYTVNLKDDGALTEQAWGKGVRYDCAEGGAVGYAEPAGTGLEAMRLQLEGVKDAIRQKGLEMVLEGGTANTTATEQLLRAGKRASRLSAITQAAQDCFERALQLTAQWIGLGGDQGGEITMGVKGDELILTAQDVNAYLASVKERAMSLKTFWAILQRGGIQADDFDADTELRQIADERKLLAEAMPQPVASSALAASSMN